LSVLVGLATFRLWNFFLIYGLNKIWKRFLNRFIFYLNLFNC
jgi:hypothetical protein